MQVSDQDLDIIIANSFKDFHVKGFDYICLRRSPYLTLKVYFFEGELNQLPEIINPHDHRYDFDTQVLCGRSENIWYGRSQDGGDEYNRFSYDTPLNGGKGFTYEAADCLTTIGRMQFKKHEVYTMRHDQIHTIRMCEEGTVLMLSQFEDVVPGATLTWTKSNEPPSLDGLYNKFTPDQMLSRLRQIEKLVPFGPIGAVLFGE
jgi:hypothetical protein